MTYQQASISIDSEGPGALWFPSRAPVLLVLGDDQRRQAAMAKIAAGAGQLGWAVESGSPSSGGSQTESLQKARQEMIRRYEAILARRADQQGSGLEPMVVLLDPWDATIGLEAVSAIARKGRGSRVHLVLGAVRRPTLPFAIKDAIRVWNAAASAQSVRW